MYVPKPFDLTDTNEAVAFMQQYSFATLVNNSSGIPLATHLPFTVKQQGEQVVLSSHLAVANSQAECLGHETSLVIFTEPHAYISPKYYEKQLNVPTWNYIAVHAYGQATIVTDVDEQLLALENMITFYDTGYLQQWATLPDDYKLKMCKGITVFNIVVTDLQGKKKLSQNRNDLDRQSVINAFSQSSNEHEQAIGIYMQTELNK